MRKAKFRTKYAQYYGEISLYAQPTCPAPVQKGVSGLTSSTLSREHTRRVLTAVTLLFLLSVSACSPPPVLPVPDFGPTDSIRCTTGGGDGSEDELVITGAGKLTYRPIKGPRVEKTLTAERTQALYRELVQAGLLDIQDVPNREMERFGILLEVKLGERTIRGSIGVLEMERKKHHAWRTILGTLTNEIEASSETST